MEAGLKPIKTMKRIFGLMLYAATVAAAASCIEEQTNEPVMGDVVDMTFVGHIDQTESKTTLDTDFSINWSSSDHITVFSGDGAGTHFTEVTVDETKKNATFKGKVELADSYYAIYPKQDAATYSSEGEIITATLPTVQTAKNGTFADGMNLAVAKASGEHLHFRNIGAILAVKCPTANANSIKIVSRDPSVKMSGRASISYNGGEPVVTPAPDAVNHVEVTCSSTAVGDVYYFVVFPGTYTKGFDIVFTSKNDATIKSMISSTKELKLDRNANVMLFNNPSGYSFGWNTSVEPTSVKASLAGTSGLAGVNVSWTADPNRNYANGYKVYARTAGATDNGELKKTISGLDTKECLIEGLAAGQTYQFGVSTSATSGNKDSQITWSSEILLPKPDNCVDPSNLKVTQISESEVTLTWQDNSSAEVAYFVYKDDGEAVNSAEVPAGTTTYTFRYLKPGTVIKFGVQARGAYSNHSQIKYAPEYKVLTWRELQDADAGSGSECSSPENIRYNQETSTAVLFNWDCWSSANIGFNFYARPASVSEFNESHLVASIDEKDLRTYLFKNLTTATEYVFGIQTKGKSVLENSDIVEIRHTVKNFDWPYPFESGRSIPTFSDMALCYGGNCERNPQYWTPERFRYTVTYVDKNEQEHWLFESMLMLELWSNWGVASYALTADGHKSSNREHWQQQLDYWFDDQYGFAALDQCIEEAKGRIGAPEKKHLVVFSLPDPVYFENFSTKTNTKYWGSIADTEMDFKNVSHRVEAYKWMINQIRALFNSKGYKNIELTGFYILNEALSVSSSSYNYQYKQHDQIIKQVTAYCHSFNEGVFWIPYNCAEGYTSWKSLGIDCTIMQPNKYWPNETTKTWDDVLTAVKNYDMGIELEFEGTHGESINSSILTKLANGSANPKAEANKTRFRTYLSKIKAESTIYKKKPIALYTGTNALYEIATSTDYEDQKLYHELCQFIIDAKH